MGGVLLVDDSLFMRHLYRLMLSKHGFNTFAEAGNGYECIALYTEHWPDAVILDINMPGMSGIETLKELRQIDNKACVVMSSAMGQEVYMRECVELGAKAFLVKPIVERVLVDTMKGVLKIK